MQILSRCGFGTTEGHSGGLCEMGQEDVEKVPILQPCRQATLPPTTAVPLQANSFRQKNGDNSKAEFTLGGFTLEGWTQADTALDNRQCQTKMEVGLGRTSSP